MAEAIRSSGESNGSRYRRNHYWESSIYTCVCVVKYAVIPGNSIQARNIGPGKSSKGGTEQTENHQVKLRFLANRHRVRLRAAGGGWRDR